MLFQAQAVRQAPKPQLGLWRLLQANLFASKLDTAITIAIIGVLFWTLPPLFNWLVLDATFIGDTQSECSKNAACWIYIQEKFNLFIYGFYPSQYYWRVHTTFALLVGLVLALRFSHGKGKLLLAIALLVVYPLVAFWLLHGGLGLVIVASDQWGGLLLTLVIATTGIVGALPLGIFLALGRQSKMPVMRYLSIAYIEFIRGVPLISILFMASVLLPLFFATGTELDKLLRALIGITLFQAAYVAEIIRGGLQAIDKGQYEAADTLGLNYWHKISLIIMPQALKISIPNLTGSCIGLFKDTTLVLIIGLFDMLSMVNLTSSDTNWLGMEVEGYILVTLIFWIFLSSMSRYSTSLEKRFNTNL